MSLGSAESTGSGSGGIIRIGGRQIRRVPAFRVAFDVLEQGLRHHVYAVVLEHLDRDRGREGHLVRSESDPLERSLGSGERAFLRNDSRSRDSVHDRGDFVVMRFRDHGAGAHRSGDLGEPTDQLILQVDGNQRGVGDGVVDATLHRLPESVEQTAAGVIQHRLKRSGFSLLALLSVRGLAILEPEGRTRQRGPSGIDDFSLADFGVKLLESLVGGFEFVDLFGRQFAVDGQNSVDELPRLVGFSSL